VFNPHMLQNIGQYYGGSEELNYAEYQTKDGVMFRNGTKRDDPLVYSSEELPFVNLTPTEHERALVKAFDAKYVEPAVTTTKDDAINQEIKRNREVELAALKARVAGNKAKGRK